MRVQEERPRLWVRRDALQQRERVAHPVRRVRGERRRREHRVDRDDLLQQRARPAEEDQLDVGALQRRGVSYVMRPPATTTPTYY